MRVFISYHTPDRKTADAVRIALKSALPQAEIFLDQNQLRFGYNWQPQLYAAISEAETFLIIVGNKLGNWQTAEYYAAHDKKVNNPDSFALLPIIVTDRSKGPVPNLPGLSQLHWVESTEPTAPDVLGRIIDAIAGKKPGSAPKPWLLVNPYRGLMALEEQDCDFFFGRELETEQTIQAIGDHPDKIISLIGMSGVGKSSLAQAGVVAALKRQKLANGKVWPDKVRDSREWLYLAFRPADQPVKALASTFVNLWYPNSMDPDKFAVVDKWTARLLGSGSISELFEATKQFLTDQGDKPPKRAFIYIDQAEELYSRSTSKDTLRLSELIAGAAKSKDFTFMLSQRADYYGNYQANKDLFDRAVIVDVAPLRPPQLLRVLREPASRLQVEFYPKELPEQLVDAAKDQPGALALLADLMIDVWDKMQKRQGVGEIRALEDAQLIDVEKALSSRADRFLQEFPDDQDIIQRLFVLKLIKIYEQGVPFRRRVYEKNCAPEEWDVLTKMSSPEWRLVVTGSENGSAFAEVAHDILLSKWPILAEWISRERKFLLWRTDIDRDFQYWVDRFAVIPQARELAGFNVAVFDRQDVSRGDNALLKGARLEEAQTYLSTRDDDIDEHSKLFIERSVRIAEKEAGLLPGHGSSRRRDFVGEPDSRSARINVYLSYSRQDSAFVDKLTEALQERDVDVAIDRHSISSGEDWRARLHQMIIDCDTVVFVVSPATASSRASHWEIDEARRLGKRIVPVAIGDTTGMMLPGSIADLNAISFAESDTKYAFIEAVNTLVKALRTDFDWLREHVRLLHRAREWDAAARPDSRLLIGSDVANAKAWAGSRPPLAPDLTELHLEFIRASEFAESERQSAERARLDEIAAAVQEREKAQKAHAAALAREKEYLQATRHGQRRAFAFLAAFASLALAAIGSAIYMVKTGTLQFGANEMSAIAPYLCEVKSKGNLDPRRLSELKAGLGKVKDLGC